MIKQIAPYKALALQISCHAINNCNVQQAGETIEQNITNIKNQILASKNFIGQDLKLVVLPEYFFTGFPMGESIELWQQKACIEKDSYIFDHIKSIAIESKIFLSGNYYELDKNFENLYFQSSFIINPNGVLILNYRRLNSMYAPTPHDVLERYVALYGKESLFPVVDTEIGKLACVTSEEILYPEITRCLAFNGAEIILHSTSEVASLMPSQKNIAKQARAFENMCYVVSANSAGILNTNIPAQSTDAHSQIVNYEGLKLCEAGFGETMVANSTINIDALRHHRNRPGMSNFMSRQRNELFSDFYNKEIYPANSISNNNNFDRTHFASTQKKVIDKLFEK